jgi:aspartate aminotransferase
MIKKRNNDVSEESGSTALDHDDLPHQHLNLNVRGMGQSATLAINEKCAELRAQGRKVFRLGLGQSPFPVPDHVVQALKQNAHQKDYLPVKGLEPLREAIVGFISRTQKLDYRPENVLVGPGTKELMFLIQLVYYGDLVIPTPSWVSYAPQANIIGRHIRWLPTDPSTGLRVTPEALEELCLEDPERPRLLIMNYPNNPTGYSYNAEQLSEIAAVARRFRVLVISDEIYSSTRFEGEHVSIARYYPDGTIISNGLSKWCGAGGWRLGAFAFPRRLWWLLAGMAAVASETFTSTSAPIQYAAITAFENHPEMDAYLTKVRAVLVGLAEYFFTQLVKKGVSLHPAHGGFYLFPNFDPLRERLEKRGIKTNIDLCNRLLQETGVAILPGYAFGRRKEELSARLAYVDFDGRKALEAWQGEGRPDESFLRRHCGRTIEAADRICDWLTN